MFEYSVQSQVVLILLGAGRSISELYDFYHYEYIPIILIKLLLDVSGQVNFSHLAKVTLKKNSKKRNSWQSQNH